MRAVRTFAIVWLLLLVGSHVCLGKAGKDAKRTKKLTGGKHQIHSGRSINDEERGNIQSRENENDDNNESGDKNKKGNSESGDIKKKGTSESGDSKNKGNSESGDSKEKGNSESGDSKEKGTSESGDSKKKGTSESGDSKNKGTSESGDSKNKGTSESGDSKKKGTSESGDSKNKGTSESGDSKKKRTSESGDSKKKRTSESGDSNKKNGTNESGESGKGNNESGKMKKAENKESGEKEKKGNNEAGDNKKKGNRQTGDNELRKDRNSRKDGNGVKPSASVDNNVQERMTDDGKDGGIKSKVTIGDNGDQGQLKELVRSDVHRGDQELSEHGGDNYWQAVRVASTLIPAPVLPYVEPPEKKQLTCRVDGVEFTGTISDPRNPCSKCSCNEQGVLTCKPICTKPMCGSAYQSLSQDGCECLVCSSTCDETECPVLDCGLNQRRFDETSCCGRCVCNYQGTEVQEGKTVSDCNECICKSGKVQCPPSVCSPKLQCVDAVYGKDCELYCPQNKTCMVGSTVIRYGDFKRVGSSLCTCLGDWFPNAFCAKLHVRSRLTDYGECLDDNVTFSEMKFYQ